MQIYGLLSNPVGDLGKGDPQMGQLGHGCQLARAGIYGNTIYIRVIEIF